MPSPSVTTILVDGQAVNKANLRNWGEAVETELNGKASSGAIATAVDAEATARAEADDTLAAAIAEKADKFAPINTQHRPGDAIHHFTSALTGTAEASADLDSSLLATNDEGQVLRLTGAGIIATRQRVAVEAGRRYVLRWALRRFTDPSDPAGDTVRIGVQWLTKNKAQISQRIVSDLELTVSDGRYIESATFDETDAAFSWPATARYMVPFVQAFGADGVTDIEVLSWEDVTDSGAGDGTLAANNYELWLAAGNTGTLEDYLAFGENTLQPIADATRAAADEAALDAAEAEAARTAAAASALAAETAEDGAQAAELGTIAAINGAGGSLGDVTLEAASRVVLAALDTTLGLTAFLTEPGREGLFTWDTSDLSARVTADEGQGVYVAPSSDTTGSSGAWVRQTKTLSFRMFGADPTGATDSLIAMRRACALACILKRNIVDSGTFLIDASVHSAEGAAAGVVYVGSATAVAPAAGTADNVGIIGDPWITIKSTASTGGNCHFKFNASTRNVFKNVVWDMTGISTVSGSSGGQVSMLDCSYFHIENVHKFKNDAGVPYSGGSLIDLEATLGGPGPNHGYVANVSNTAGASGVTAAVVNGSGITFTHFEHIHGRYVSEVIDFANCDDNTLLHISAEDLKGYGYIFDFGSSSRNKARFIYGKTVGAAVLLKTELYGGTGGGTALPGQIGSNDNVFEDIQLRDFWEGVVTCAAGATSTLPQPHTLARNKFHRVRARSTVVDAATRPAFLLARGDTGSGEGFVIDDVNLDVNQGYCIQWERLTAFRFSNIVSNASLFLRSVVATEYKTVDSLIENCVSTGGGFSLGGLFGITMRNIKVVGAQMRFKNCTGLRGYQLRVENAPADALYIEFENNASVPANRDTVVDGFVNRNNSLTTAGSHGVKVTGVTGSDIIDGVHLNRILIEDDQAVPTSGGFNFGTVGASRRNSLTASETRNIVSTSFTHFPGANGFNHNPLGIGSIARILTHTTDANVAFNISQLPTELLLWNVPTQAAQRVLSLQKTLFPNIGHKVRVKITASNGQQVVVRDNDAFGTVLKIMVTGDVASFMYDGTNWVLA